MNRLTPNYLRLHTEESPPAEMPEVAALESLPELCRAFEEATGWALCYAPGHAPAHDPDLKWSAPVDPGVGASPGHFRMDPGRAGWARGRKLRVELSSVKPLGEAVARLTGEAVRGETLLWQREAELAAGVPVTPQRDGERHLAERLEALLSSVCRTVGCQAAALYLLDTDTTHLKLRSVFGLPRRRLVDPPRPLEGALADLEALLGHAIVLEDTRRYTTWTAPENFPAAVCVPISTATVPLGTLWLYSTAPRDFSDDETNIIEIVAGRIAVELEREMLLAAGAADVRRQRQLAAAERMQQEQLPRVAPLVEGWSMAGRTDAAVGLGGQFFDWFPLADDRVAAVVADAATTGPEGAIAAATLRGIIRAHAENPSPDLSLLTQVNRTVWLSSPGDARATAAIVMLAPRSGQVRWSAAGHPTVLYLGAGGEWRSLALPNIPLGGTDDTSYAWSSTELAPGDVLLVATSGARDLLGAGGTPLGESGLASLALPHFARSPQELIDLLGAKLSGDGPDTARLDRTLLVIRREPH